MANRWMRFNYTDPVPCIDQITGKRTGKSILYLRAVRSDNFLYVVHSVVPDEGLINDSTMECVRIELRKTLETFIDEVPEVAPMNHPHPYRGVDNWTEAIVH